MCYRLTRLRTALHLLALRWPQAVRLSIPEHPAASPTPHTLQPPFAARPAPLSLFFLPLSFALWKTVVLCFNGISSALCPHYPRSGAGDPLCALCRCCPRPPAAVPPPFVIKQISFSSSTAPPGWMPSRQQPGCRAGKKIGGKEWGKKTNKQNPTL